MAKWLRADRSKSTSYSPEYGRIADKATGLKFWLPLALLIAAVIIVTPAVWALVLHGADISLGTGGSASTAFATIGGIMGAIFTVGGLVVALVSVYTQLAIESRIRQSFAELLPDLDDRARMQIEAHLAFTRATEESNWRTAQQLADEALKKWPTLKGVRSYLGNQMAQDVEEWFYLHEVQHSNRGPVANMGSVFDTWSYLVSTPPYSGMSVLGKTLASSSNPALNLPREELPLMEAISWLKDAIAHGEDADSMLRARLALMYAGASRFQDMFTEVKAAVTANAKLKAYLQQPRYLSMLAYAACADSRNVVSRLQDIATILDCTLPASPKDVLASLQSVTISDGRFNWEVNWVVVEKPTTPAGSASTALLAFQLGVREEVRTGAVIWSSGEGQRRYFPEGLNHIELKKLVGELADKVWFICQDETGFPSWG